MRYLTLALLLLSTSLHGTAYHFPTFRLAIEDIPRTVPSDVSANEAMQVSTDGVSLRIYDIATKRTSSQRFSDFLHSRELGRNTYPAQVSKLQLSPDGKALLMYYPGQQFGDLYLLYFAEKKVVYLAGYKPVINATFDGNDRVIVRNEAGLVGYDLTRIVPGELAPPQVAEQPVPPSEFKYTTPPPE